MAEISKQALKVENNTSFPNNNIGAITPSILRAFNVDMIDSLVDEQTYNVDSGSWNQQIDALEQFTASASGLTTGSLLVTASAASNVITFTKGDGSTFNVTVADTTDLSQLNQATASLQQYTASANIKFSNLDATTASLNTSITNLNLSSASQQVSINNLNSTTASLLVETQNLELFSASALVSISNLNASSASQQTQINNLIAATGSYATTGSNTFTGPNTFTSISASSFVSASTFVGDGSKLTNITASIALPILDEGIPQGNAVSMNFTGSGISATIVGGTAIVSVYAADSASFNALTASYNQFTASTNADLAAIHQATSSLQSFTASFSTASLVSTSSFNQYTASNDQRVSSLESATSSLFLSASLAITTASVNNDDITFTKGDGTQFTIQVATGSFALSASYAETASIARNVVITARNGNPSTLPAGTVVRITSAVGDNPIFNTASYDSETLSSNTLGILRYSSPSGADVEVVVNGIVLGVNTDPTLGYAAGDVLYLSSSGQFTKIQPQAPLQTVTLGEVLRAQQNNGSIYVNISNGWELNELHNVQITTASLATGDLLVYESASYGLWKNKSISGAGLVSTSSFNQFTSSVNSTTASLLTSASLGLTTASFNNGTRNLTFTKGDATTFSVNIPDVSGSTINTGSFATTGSNTFTGNQNITNGGALNVLGQYPNISVMANEQFSGSQYSGIYTYLDTSLYSNDGVYGGFGVSESNTPLNLISLAGNSYTKFGPETVGGIFGGGQNQDGSDAAIIIRTGSADMYVEKPTSFSYNVNITGSLTASLANGYVWVGNSLNRTIAVSTSSFASLINTGSFATTGSNSFTGSQNVYGAIQASDSPIGPQYLAPTVFQGVGSQSVAYDQFVNAGNFDALHIETQLNNGTLFQDLDPNGFTFNTWLQVPANGGANPKPIMLRGLEVTGSTNIQNLTASLQNGYVWVGNASGKTTTVATSSFGGGGAAFPYTGSAVITGSLGITGSLSGLPITLSVASNTASLDMSAGNQFVLTLPSSSTTHINPTNIKAGQTINLLIKQQVGPGTGSIAFAPSILFPSGLDMQATATGSAIDLISMISFDTTNLMAANVKNLK